MFRQKVSQFIEEKRLFQKNEKLLVALSGGADSVALLRVLLELGYSCEAAHCNFHLRGAESNRDERFVTDLCNGLHIPLHLIHFETEQFANVNHISIEMAARQLRYQWFEKLIAEVGATHICVAHHQDDSVETFMLNLLRGAGLQGLRGIPVVNGKIVRPLLAVTREEILTYLETLSQPFVTDSTNLETHYMRNKVRLELLPLMESLQSNVREHIIHTAQHLDEAYTLYNSAIHEGKRHVLSPEGIRIEALKKEPAPLSLLHEILSPLGFNSVQEAEILQSLDAQSGKVFRSPTHQLVKDRELLIISEIKAPQEPKLTYEEFERTSDFVIPKQSDIACLDADKIHVSLALRKVQQGDSFVPLGMRGRKLVSDFLTDRKCSLVQKQNQWVLCDGDTIVWLIGQRIDHRYRVTEQTKRILLVRLLT